MISVIQKLVPVFTVVLAYIFLKERITKVDHALNAIAIIASFLVTLGDHE